MITSELIKYKLKVFETGDLTLEANFSCGSMKKKGLAFMASPLR